MATNVTSNNARKDCKIEEFQLEAYFAKYEFVTKYLLCCSDAESFTIQDMLNFADLECLKLWNHTNLGYTECKGLPALRRALCEEEYPGLAVDNVMCFAGAEEGIFCAMKSILLPEDHAIVITPCYQSLKSIPESICETTTVDLELDGTWALDINKVRNAVKRKRTKAIVMNCPHNPTGQMITHSQQDMLISIAREFNLWIFCDEVYKGVERQDSDILPPIAVAYDKGVSLGAVSKAYGLAGLRIGWIACQSIDLIDEMSGQKHYLSICNSSPSEILALIAIKQKMLLLDRNKNIVVQNEKILQEFLNRHPQMFAFEPPKGGCCGFMKVNLPDDVDLAKVADILVNEYGVLILPGENFPLASNKKKDLAEMQKYFRIGLGRLNFKEALQAFEEAMPQVLQKLGVENIGDLWGNASLKPFTGSIAAPTADVVSGAAPYNGHKRGSISNAIPMAVAPMHISGTDAEAATSVEPEPGVAKNGPKKTVPNYP